MHPVIKLQDQLIKGHSTFHDPAHGFPWGYFDHREICCQPLYMLAVRGAADQPVDLLAAKAATDDDRHAEQCANLFQSTAQQLQISLGFGRGRVIETVPGSELGNGHFREGEMGSDQHGELFR
ncbi:hypothetical protein D3C76_1561910 [compost metagenome]